MTGKDSCFCLLCPCYQVAEHCFCPCIGSFSVVDSFKSYDGFIPVLVVWRCQGEQCLMVFFLVELSFLECFFEPFVQGRRWFVLAEKVGQSVNVFYELAEVMQGVFDAVVTCMQAEQRERFFWVVPQGRF